MEPKKIKSLRSISADCIQQTSEVFGFGSRRFRWYCW